MTEGMEIRAESAFRIAFVVTLQHIMRYDIVHLWNKKKAYCHSMASSILLNPSGRAFSRLFINGKASIADPT